MNAAEQQIKDWHEAEMQKVFEDDTWWPTTKAHFLIQVLRRIFLYMCEEADREGVL